MRYYRCKCGDLTAWSSMGVDSCTRCDKCGSDLAEAPDLHREPAEHEWVTRYDEITGEPHEECKRCGILKPTEQEADNA